MRCCRGQSTMDLAHSIKNVSFKHTQIHKFWTSIRPQSLPFGFQAFILEYKALLNICDVFY